jgi:hypothetical protein
VCHDGIQRKYTVVRIVVADVPAAVEVPSI